MNGVSRSKKGEVIYMDMISDYTPSKAVVSRIIALPSPDTITRLREILAQAPLTLDPFETLHITLVKNFQDTAEQRKRMDEHQFPPQIPFVFLQFRHWYDTAIETNKLSGRCVVQDDIANEVTRLQGKPRNLYMTFRHVAPALSRTTKSFLASVEDTLVFKEVEQPFLFSGIHVIDENDYEAKFKAHYITNDPK